MNLTRYEMILGDFGVEAQASDEGQWVKAAEAASALAASKSAQLTREVLRDVACMRLIQLLRQDEASMVSLFCDNPDPPTALHTHAIECSAYWTNFETDTFRGETLLAALEAAVVSKMAYDHLTREKA